MKNKLINTLTTVRDFKIVFERYAAFEESVIQTKMESQQDPNADVSTKST